MRMLFSFERDGNVDVFRFCLRDETEMLFSACGWPPSMMNMKKSWS